MNRNFNRSFLFPTGVLILVATLMAACGTSTQVQFQSVNGTGTINVHVSDPATCEAPMGPYSNVYVTIKNVRAHRSATAEASDAGWVDLTPDLAANPKQVDLLGAGSTQCFLATLDSGTQLDAGQYQQIRLILLDNNSGSMVADNKCQGNDANCVVLAADGIARTLRLSSEANTGIKIPSGQIAGGKFVIEEGQVSDLNIDLNACASIVIAGGGQFRLKPVLHAGEVSLVSNSIQGKVVDSATGQPISGGSVIVALEQATEGVDRVIMQTAADASGNFSFCPVPEGSFDVVAAAEDGSGVAYAATVTTGVQAGTAMGNVPLIATSGTSTAPASIMGQVTTSTGSAATPADVSLSALQPIAANGGTLLVTIPLAQQSATTVNVATAGDAACPANTACASYTLSVPGANPNVGAFNSSGTTYAQNTTDPVKYTVDALAFVPSSGGTANCTPSNLQTNTKDDASALTVMPGDSVTASTLAFTGCQ